MPAALGLLEEIGGDVSRALQEIVSLISDPAWKSAINRIDEAAANIETLSGSVNRSIDEARLNRLLTGFEQSLANLDTLIRRMNRSLVDAKLPESAQAFRSATEAVVDSRMEFNNMIFKVNQAVDSFRMLVDYLESDPGALLRGKERPSK